MAESLSLKLPAEESVIKLRYSCKAWLVWHHFHQPLFFGTTYGGHWEDASKANAEERANYMPDTCRPGGSPLTNFCMATGCSFAHAEFCSSMSWIIFRPLQWVYLFLITQSLVEARGRMVIIIIHYYDSSGSLVNSNSPSMPSLEFSNVRKNSHMVIASKLLWKISHGSNTFPTPSQTTVALRYTVLYYRDGAEKTA